MLREPRSLHPGHERAHMTLVIQDRRDLHRAGHLVSWLNRPAVDLVQVTLPWLDSREQQRNAKALKFYLNDCGCLWGVPAFVAAFAGCLAMAPSRGGQTWIAVGLSLLVAVAAALVAKLAALAWSRWRLRVLLDRMARGDEPQRAA